MCQYGIPDNAPKGGQYAPVQGSICSGTGGSVCSGIYTDTVKISIGTRLTGLRTYHYVDSDDRLVYIEMTFTSPRDSLLVFFDRYVGVLRSHKWSINENWRREFVDSTRVFLGYYNGLALRFVMMNPGDSGNESDIEVNIAIGTP